MSTPGLAPGILSAFAVTVWSESAKRHVTIGHVSLSHARAYDAFTLGGSADFAVVRHAAGWDSARDGYTTALDAANALVQMAVDYEWCPLDTPLLTELPTL